MVVAVSYRSASDRQRAGTKKRRRSLSHVSWSGHLWPEGTTIV